MKYTLSKIAKSLTYNESSYGENYLSITKAYERIIDSDDFSLASDLIDQYFNDPNGINKKDFIEAGMQAEKIKILYLQ